jgi:transcriptional regulator with XRE-family HTH domain
MVDADAANQAVGRRIRQARKAKGLTLDELAALMKCSSQRIRHLEIAKTRINIPDLIALTTYLDTDLLFLLQDLIGVSDLVRVVTAYLQHAKADTWLRNAAETCRQGIGQLDAQTELLKQILALIEPEDVEC